MNKPDKASRMIQYLEDRIMNGAYAPGDRLPSVRFLMLKFGLSSGTVSRGIDYLIESTRRLEKIPSRGIYYKASADQTEAGGKVLGVFHSPFQEKDGLFYSAMKSIRINAERDGYTLRFVPLSREEATEEIILKLSAGCDGIIFLQEYDDVISNLRIPVPAVGIMMENSFNGTISTVNMDYWSVAEMAVEYFKRHNVHHVVASGSHELVYMKRCRTFAMLWREQGGTCRIIKNVPGTFQKGVGYFFSSDSWANSSSIRYKEKHGVSLAMDHVIIGVDGKQLLMPDFHRFPTVAINWETMGSVAYHECVARIKDPARFTEHIYLQGWCVERF